MRVFFIFGWLIASLFLTSALSWAAESDVDRLLEFLIKEKVITQEKATEFRADLAVKKQEEKQPAVVPEWVTKNNYYGCSLLLALNLKEQIPIRYGNPGYD